MLKIKNVTKKKAPTKPKIFDINYLILVDASTSMAPWKEQTIKILREQVAAIKQGAKTSLSKTVNFAIGTFSSFDITIENFTDVKKIDDVDDEEYQPSGNTPLMDAIYQGIKNFDKFSDRADVNNLIVITDGEENSSTKVTRPALAKLISDRLGTDQWTIAMCMPPGKTSYALALGIPQGCVTEWEQTKVGYQKLSSGITRGITRSYNLSNAGTYSNKSFFAPDLDHTKSQVKNNLDNVSKNFQKFSVGHLDDPSIGAFFRDKTGHTYAVGTGFYQLSKTETIQDYKDLVIMDKATGEIFGGSEVRNMLGIPTGGTIELNPTYHGKWDVFARSTSWNRKLVPGTKALLLKSPLKK